MTHSAVAASLVEHSVVAPRGSLAARSFWVKPSKPASGITLHASSSTTEVAITSGAKLHADPGVESIATELASGKSVPWSIVVGLTLLTLLPALLLSMTPLVRLLVVFHFLRQALGTQTAPSNQVLMGLALMMTWFLMQPVMLQVEQQAIAPYQAGKISGMQAVDRGV